MQVSTTKMLDNRYVEFIEDLESLGELRNVTRLVAHLLNADEIPFDDAETDQELREIEASAAIRTLWENGWIEVREVKRESKGGLRKAYALRIYMEKIARYFEQERLKRSILAREVIPQEAQA